MIFQAEMISGELITTGLGNEIATNRRCVAFQKDLYTTVDGRNPAPVDR